MLNISFLNAFNSKTEWNGALSSKSSTFMIQRVEIAYEWGEVLLSEIFGYPKCLGPELLGGD